ncbi:uncharacterized protein LOC135689469 [Rhopilema esculentum]|uniref:uncharacterized protein LOC135689469 n=1 Tax=Rhopilema esculentum TaxID=499914 RepID=UPI0031DA8AB6
MSCSSESESDTTFVVDYNPVVKFMNAFPVGFFTPNDGTMANLFEEIKLHIGKLFDVIKKCTDIVDCHVVEQLKKRCYQKTAFNEIKNAVQFILDRLVQLHSYADNNDVADYVELCGNFLKRLVDAWNNFFARLYRISFTKHQKRAERYLKRRHRLAECQTQSLQIKLQKLVLKMNGVFPTCKVKPAIKIKECFFDSLLLFHLAKLKFEVQCAEETDSEEETPKDEDLSKRRKLQGRKRKRASTENCFHKSKENAEDRNTLNTRMATGIPYGGIRLTLKRDGRRWVACFQECNTRQVQRNEDVTDKNSFASKKSSKRRRLSSDIQ